MTRVAGLVVALLAAAAGPAQAGPLGLEACGIVQGVYQCSGLVSTWDGVPLDTTVTLPSEGSRGLALVVDIHGFGNSKHEYLDPNSRAYTDNAFNWAREGYAVLTYTARGLWGSCGTPEARLAHPDTCARGYIRLADTRYEVRDSQELVGRLVDEGVADADRIGATGDSYGGGQTFALAALRDRVMQPDGTLVPWKSPKGRPIALAAAAPVIPWTHLVAAIAPNGRTRHRGVTPTPDLTEPVGVFKLSYANAILVAASVATGPGQPTGQGFVLGRPEGYIAPPLLDPEADVTSWVTRADAGEPYSDPDIRRIIDAMVRFHSAYGIEASHPPPPLFVGAGFTDDLCPVDETLRFVERMRRDHPAVPASLLFGDFGHQRATNKPADRERLVKAIHAWFDHYLRDRGGPPARGVTVTTQTCPRDQPSEGPFSADRFGDFETGLIRYEAPEPQRVESGSADLGIGGSLDPVAGGGNGCVETHTRRLSGTAVYELPAAPKGGTLMIGAPRVRMKSAITGNHPLVAARLWDVAPDGRSQRLVARGTMRPVGEASAFELHANAWRFAEGHRPKLELLGQDAPYARPSNGSFTVTVSGLALELPVHAPRRGGSAPVIPVVRPRLAVACSRGRRLVIVRRPGDARRAWFLLDGRRVSVDNQRPFRRYLHLRRSAVVTVRLIFPGGGVVEVSRRVRRC